MAVTPWAELSSGAPRHDRAGRYVETIEEPFWAARPKFYFVNGVEMEFFGIRALAVALGRSPETIRRWEATRIMPRLSYWRHFENPRARRRLWTRSQIEEVVRIAREEGVLGHKVANFDLTNFSERMFAMAQLWRG
jgi:hypothetical protein